MTAQKTLFEKIKENAVINNFNEINLKSSNFRIKIILFLSTVVLCTFFFNFRVSKRALDVFELNTEPGYIWPGQTIIAEFSFPIYKTNEEYKNEILEARKNALDVFILDNSVRNYSRKILENSFATISDSIAHSYEQVISVISDKESKRKLQLNYERTLKNIDIMKKILLEELENAYKNGFINIAKNNLKTNKIIVKTELNKEIILPTYNLVDSSLFLTKCEKIIEKSIFSDVIPLSHTVIKSIMKPNLIYSEQLTKEYEELLVQSVAKTNGVVRKGETIVEKGQKVTSDIIKKLRSYEQSKFMKSETDNSFIMLIGSFGHALLIILILFIYLFFIRKRIFADNIQVAILCSIIVLVSIFSWLTLEFQIKFPIEYLILLPSLSMLTAIVFDSRTAFYVTVTMSLMVSGIRGNDYDTGTAMLFAGTLAAYTVRDIKSRTQMFQSIFYIFIGFLLPIVAFGFERASDIFDVLNKLLAGLLNAMIAPLVTFGLLFILERISNITTDLKLEEYSSLKHPLLVKLSEIAPGTYQHTLAIANLAQNCCFAIGANDLLAKVGAYFHDIGKISRPEYFVENQTNIDNKHDLLSPKKSAEAIKSHVAEGIRLAKEYKLPQRIIDFIPMHHGTSLIKFFYTKALEEMDKSEFTEEDFRYDGPKPNSKETAIVMICDSAEAVSRLGISDPEELRSMITKIVNEKLLDGQFSECNLTFKELDIIINICVKNLAGLVHPRIAYKDIPNQNGQ